MCRAEVVYNSSKSFILAKAQPTDMRTVALSNDEKVCKWYFLKHGRVGSSDSQKSCMLVALASALGASHIRLATDWLSSNFRLANLVSRDQLVHFSFWNHILASFFPLYLMYEFSPLLNVHLTSGSHYKSFLDHFSLRIFFLPTNFYHIFCCSPGSW